MTPTARLCRILVSFFLFAVFFLSPMPIRAETAEITTGATTPSPSPDMGLNGVSLDAFSEGDLSGWMSDEGIIDLSLTEEDGHPVLLADTKENENGVYTVLHLFAPERLNLIEHTHLSASLRIDGDADALYTVSLTLYSGLSTVTAEVEIPGGSWYAISADLSSWYLRTGVDLFELRVHDRTGAGVDGLFIGSLTANGNASLAIADTFLTFGFTADGGTARYEDGAYLLDAEEDGVMTLVADAARSDYSAADGICALKIVLADAVQGGTVSLAVSDAFSGLSSFDISSSCQLYAGTNTYLLPFDEALALHAYRLSFRGLYAEDAETKPVRLLSVSLVRFPKADTTAYPGKLTECSFSSGFSSLTVAGTLPSGTVADNMNGTLALYEIPVWSDLPTVLTNDAPIATIKISTRFTFQVDLTGRESSAAVSRFAVFLLTEDHSIPVAASVFPSPSDTETRSTRSVVGLAGADSAGVFAANASNVIVDVYVDELLGGVENSSSGRLCIRGGRYYYLDTAYLRQLDEEIRFYAAADVDVYLRLLCGTDLSARNFTFSYDGAGFFAFDITNEDGAYMLSAITDYLAEAYPSLRGIIVGERLDSAVYNGADMSDIDKYAALCADTMQIVYTAAAAHIPDISVIAPIGHYLAEQDHSAVALSRESSDPILLSAYLSRHIAESGSMPLSILYVSDSSDQMIGHTENMLGRMSAVHAAPPAELFFLWQPAPIDTTDFLLREYEERCASAARLGVRTFFLDIRRQTNKDTLCQRMKYTEAEADTARRLYEFSASLVSEDTSASPPMGEYTLYDFTKSFSTLHWIAGSGCDRLTTEAGTIESGKRSLHADFPADADSMHGSANGNILCMIPSVLDFSAAPVISYTLLVTSPSGTAETAEIVFVFGSDDARAEYVLTVLSGEPVTVSCDLSLYDGAASINSAAILVRATSAVTLDISRIQCSSTTHTSSQLKEHFASAFSSVPGNAQAPFSLSLGESALLILLGVATLSVFALLSRQETGRRKTLRSSEKKGGPS